MAITYATYGDVKFFNVFLQEVSTEIQYDASGTDQLFTQTHLTISGYVFLGVWRDTTRPHAELIESTRMLSPRELESVLSQPRKHLHIWQESPGGPANTLWLVFPAGEESVDHKTDCDGGPKPQNIRIIQSFPWGYQVEFTIQFALQDRDKQSRFAPDKASDWALSNRWSVTEAFNEDFFCTKTYRGVIRLSSAVAAKQVEARKLAFPQLEPGFRRQSAEYTVSESGLEIHYQIVDQQEAHAPPWPCTRWECQHSESLARFGYRVQSTCRVKLWGPPGLPKAFLLARMAQILRARLEWDTQRLSNAFLESLRIIDDVSENSVSGEMTMNRFPCEKRDPDYEPQVSWFRRLARDVLGTTLQISPLKDDPKLTPYGKQPSKTESPYTHIRPDPKGYRVFGDTRTPAEIVFFACYYQVPERPPHEFHPGKAVPQNERSESQTISSPPIGLYPVPMRVPELDEKIPNQLSESHAQNLYTHARMQNEYDYFQGNAVLPLSPSAAAEDHCLVVSLTKTLIRRRLRYEGERVGDWPEIPQPADYELPEGGRARLLRFNVRPQPPTLAADGMNLIYRVEADYEWVFTRPTRQLDAGVLPYIKADAVKEFTLEKTEKPQLTWNVIPRYTELPEIGIA